VLKVKLLIAFALIALVAGCRWDMQDQPKYLAFRGSEIFPDSLSSRPLVEGTVARGYLREDDAYYTGKTSAKAAGDTSKSNMGEVNEFPFPITKEIVDRGQERYNIYCSPCHGVLGDGRGMVVNRGFRPPPSYHQDRLRTATLGHFYDVITNGFGAMPDYSMQIPPHERWAIISYIRALQFSQNAKVSDVPQDQIANLK
jgi:mono/diheme cytochrome c family protein